MPPSIYTPIICACVLVLLFNCLLAGYVIYQRKQGFLWKIYYLQHIMSIDEILAISEKALFINQRKHVARRRHMETLLGDMGCIGMRIEPLEDEIPWKSLTATHRFCLEQVAARQEPHYVCIFEDDAELAAELPRIAARRYIENSLRDVYRQNDKLAFVKFGSCMDPNQKPTCLPGSCQNQCTHACMLAPHAARTRLSMSASCLG